MRRSAASANELSGRDEAVKLCCRNPALVAAGDDVQVEEKRRKKRRFTKWLKWKKAG